MILSLSLGLKLILKRMYFSGVFGCFSERVLIFEQIYLKYIENIGIFIKLEPKMSLKCTIDSDLIFGEWCIFCGEWDKFYTFLSLIS